MLTCVCKLNHGDIVIIFQAGLDAWNEQCVTDAIINNRPKGQTVIAVAQTLSTIREADEIIFVGADGTIKEQGTWDELVALKGGFAEFVRIQSLTRTNDAADDAAGAGAADAESGAPISPALSQDGDGPTGSVPVRSESIGGNGTSTAMSSGGGGGGGNIIASPVDAAARWRIARTKLSAASRLMQNPSHLDGEDGSASIISNARAHQSIQCTLSCDIDSFALYPSLVFHVRKTDTVCNRHHGSVHPLNRRVLRS